MKKLFYVFSALLVIISCQAESEDPEDVSTVQITQAKNEEPRPFKGSTSASIAFFDPGTEGCGGTFLVVTGGGTSTHTGKYTFRFTDCFDSPSPRKLVGTVTAANGDQLYVEQVGGSDDVPGSEYDVYEWKGGTGKFAGASGSYTSTYSTYDFENNIFISEQVGTLTY